MKKIILLSLIISLPLIYGCKEKKVTYSESGSTVDLVVGQILKIELPANASSGNRWRKIAYEDSVLARKGKPNYMLADDRIGSAGVYYYKFSAIGPGTSKILMEYGNKYDDDKKAVKIFKLTVVVHDKDE